MKRRALAEIVGRYVDGLCAGTDSAESYLSVFPQFRGELAPSFGLAYRLKEVLVPVEPSPEFARSLESRLLAAWRVQKAQREARRRGWVIRAAAVGSLVSLAAIAAIFARTRGEWVTMPAIKLR